MRQRLDLDALLRKYETNYSPRDALNDPGYLSPRTLQPKHRITKLKTESSYYPENDLKYFNTVANIAQPKMDRYTTRDKVASVNFQMSKSECENLLHSMKEELGSEEKEMEGFINDCIVQLMQKFDKQHEDMRRELISLVDHSLQQNKRAALDMIQSYRRQFPREYTSVSRKMALINEEINALLNGLNSNSFKKTIAEVVTKDFSEVIKKMRDDIQVANASYRDGLSHIELDRSKIAKIQESLQKIYIWRTKEDGLKVPDDREDLMRSSRRSSKRKIFDQKGMNKLAMTEREHSERSAPKNMRRTFFNFDN